MLKKFLIILLLLPTLASAMQILITPETFDIKIAAGDYSKKELFIQNDAGADQNVEFLLSKTLTPYIHIIPESKSIYSVYTLIPERAREQKIKGTMLVEVTTSSRPTTANIHTIAKSIPVKIEIEGKLENPMPLDIQGLEEPVIPLSTRTLPILLLIFILLFLVNLIIRNRNA